MSLPDDRIELEVLGSGDAFCSHGRNQTCFHLKSGKFHFLVDFGATSLAALKNAGKSPVDIDAILLTHFHADHFGGIPFLLIDLGYNQPRTKDLTIVGPRGIKEKILTALELAYPGTDLGLFKYKTVFKEYREGKDLRVGPIRLQAIEVVHSEGTNPHGFRLYVGDKILGFSGDTGWTEKIFDISEGADLFLCECNFYDTELQFHLNYHQIKNNLHRFNSKRVILNHLGREMLENREEKQIECAWDGMKIEI